jgi:hypothetical protein
MSKKHTFKNIYIDSRPTTPPPTFDYEKHKQSLVKFLIDERDAILSERERQLEAKEIEIADRLQVVRNEEQKKDWKIIKWARNISRYFTNSNG